MSDIIQLEDKYYIDVNSSYADDRVKILNRTNTFAIFDRWGDLKQLGEEVQGIYHNGTRYLSDLELRINGRRPLLLSSSIKEENEILSVDLTNPTFPDLNGVRLEKGSVYIGRSKFVRNGACYEQIRLSNFSTNECLLEISLAFNADFRDIFEIRGIKRAVRGEVDEIKHLPDSRLYIGYTGLDKVRRITQITFSRKPDGWEHHNKAVFNIRLAPHQQYNFDYTIDFLTGEEVKDYINYETGRKLLEEDVRKSSLLIADIRTSNEQFNQWLERSKVDLLSLLGDTEYGKYPFAGVPWYNTPFGRDGIITALQTLWVAPAIAREVLLYLAGTQARAMIAERDAEPGKIIHEVRGGEMVELGELPFKRYYGSVDATPLFIILAGAYFERTADISTIREIWDSISDALYWIDHYGDVDGDGFVEYQHKSERGLSNQGWKDSFDSVSHEDGQLAISPIALCEVQGYVYQAKQNASVLAKALGNDQRARELAEEAFRLKNHFNDTFWDASLPGYVIALDGEKRPCRITASNMGHCLFSGIADADKAEQVVKRMMQEDMYSGWGIRTLGKNEKRYNPMSYHNGSVWPHDVSMIASGFARYGFFEEALQLTQDLFEASLFLELQRLPELFCGFDRRRSEGPTDYPVACSPQAWAVGSVFMLLEACLNIKINAADKVIYFRKAHLPAGIDKIEISNFQLDGRLCRLSMHYQDGSISATLKNAPAGWQVLTITDAL